MDIFLNILLWGGIFFLMMRFGCGSHAKRHNKADTKNESIPADQLNRTGHSEGRMAHDPDVRWIPPSQDIDPVCGTSVDTGKAKSTVFDGKVYYFCSRDCREIFEAAPDLYVGNDTLSPLKKEHSHVSNRFPS